MTDGATVVTMSCRQKVCICATREIVRRCHNFVSAQINLLTAALKFGRGCGETVSSKEIRVQVAHITTTLSESHLQKILLIQ